MLRKITIAALAVFLTTAAWVSLRASNIPLISGTTSPSAVACSEASQEIACLNNLINQINSGVAGYYAAILAPVAASATSTEQTLASVAVPTGAIASPGQALRLRCSGISAANVSAKTIKLYWGNNVYSSGSFAGSASGWDLEMLVIAATTTNTISTARGTQATTVIAPVASTDFNTVDQINGPVTVKCTGTTDGTASEVTLETLYIEQVK